MNIVILTGNLTRAPEYGTTKNGIACCKFSIAVQRKYSDANGERITDFFDCTAWRQTAEYCAKYLTKGTKVAVEGSLATNEYVAKDGTKRKTFNIVVDNVEISFTKIANDEQKEQTSSPSLIPVDEDELPF